MKKLVFLLSLFVISTSVYSQSACDSVTIDCCFTGFFKSDSLVIKVSNTSSDIFSYPGFVLFNENGDTLSKETVFYYGLGPNPDPHLLPLEKELDLPFSGILELHTNFYQNLACSFPFYIPDTTLTLAHNEQMVEVNIYPNPATESFIVSFDESSLTKPLKIIIRNTLGTIIYQNTFKSNALISRSSIGETGFYLLDIVHENKILSTHKLLLK